MLDRAIGRFQAYVDRFLTGEATDDGRVNLKREHSLMVLAEARMLTRSLGVAPEAADLIHLAALFHDTGRFPQYAAYKTFRDAISVNHGRLGVSTLRREGLLADLTGPSRALIYGAIVMHNRFALPAAVAAAPTSPLALAAQVVRDADKLDILRVMVGHFEADGGGDEVVTMALPDRPNDYSPALVAPLFGGQVARYTDMACQNDMRLLLISWVYGFSFPAARQEAFSRGLIGRLFAGLPRTSEIETARDHVFRLAPGGKHGA